MILFLGAFEYGKAKNWGNCKWIYSLMVLLLFFTTVSHLLIALPLLYIWIYQFLSIDVKESKHRNHAYVYGGLILLFIGFRVWLSYNSWYDGSKLNGIKQASSASLLSSFTNEQARSIMSLIFTKHWMFVVLCFWGLFDLIRKKNFLLCALTVACGLVYFVLVTLTYDKAITEYNLFYFESQWMCWTLVLCYPFISETIGSLKNRKYIVLVYLAIFLSKVLPFSSSVNKFQNRYEVLEDLVHQAKKDKRTKTYLYKNQDIENQLLMSWGLPAETLLLSSIQDENNSISIAIFDKSKKVSSAKDSIYTAFKFLPEVELNSKYFKLNPKQSYTALSNDN